MKLFLKPVLTPGMLGLVLLLGACSSTPEQKKVSPVAQAERAVMDRHDSLMVQTGQLYELKQKVAQAKVPGAARYIQSLEAADNAMMSWMHQYRAPDSTLSEAQRLAYFQQQQQRLNAVEKQQRGIIDSVTALLAQRPVTSSVK